MTYRVDQLNQLFTRPNIAYLVGKTISSDSLLQLCLESTADSSQRSFLPIDHIEFIDGVIASNDEGKIGLLSGFSSFGQFGIAEKFTDLMFSEKYLINTLSNSRIKYAQLPNDFDETIIRELKKSEDVFYLSPLLKAFAKNPYLDRKRISDVISGKHSFNSLSPRERYIFGREAITANYIDDSFSGQDMPTTNELDFDKPNISFLNIIIDYFDKKFLLEKEIFDKFAVWDVIKLFGSSCFDSDKFSSQKDYGLKKQESIANTLVWVENHAKKYSELSKLNESEVQHGLIFSFILYFAISSQYIDSDSHPALLALKNKKHWVFDVAASIFKFLHWYEECKELDELLYKAKYTTKYDSKYLKEKWQKLKLRQPQVTTAGGLIAYQLTWNVVDRDSFKNEGIADLTHFKHYWFDEIQDGDVLSKKEFKFLDFLKISKNYRKKGFLAQFDKKTKALAIENLIDRVEQMEKKIDYGIAQYEKLKGYSIIFFGVIALLWVIQTILKVVH